MGIWLVVSLVLCVVLSSQRTRSAEARSGAATLVSPALGVPVSFEQIEERSGEPRLAGGAPEAIKSKVYRDSSGRIRQESDSPKASEGPASPIVTITDPMARSVVVLIIGSKLAYRTRGPVDSSIGISGFGEGLPAGNWATKTEDLGRRIIAGVECEGRRLTQTAEGGGVTPPVNTIETWYSSDLKLTASAIAFGPYGKHSARIENLQRSEPDPILFQLPPDYKVIDLKAPSAE